MTDYTELKTAIEYILNQGALEREFIEDADALDAAWAVYEALGPTDILALIADIEDARNGMKHSCAIRLKKRIELLETQRDQLIADNERLTNRLEVDPRHDYDGISTRDATIKVLDEQVDQLKADNERLEVEVKRMTSIAYAAHGAFRMETMAERDQLRAEVAGLRTGYEAYERVNAELKAEVEWLRKELAARHPFKFAQESPAIGFTGCVICGVYTDHGGLPCPKTRATAIAHAAMGKGERS